MAVAEERVAHTLHGTLFDAARPIQFQVGTNRSQVPLNDSCKNASCLLMPILPGELDLFPAELFNRLGEAPVEPGQWWAMYTMARREKELMRRLRALEIAFYSPLVPKRTRSPSGRVRESFVPLFASYVFVHGNEEQRYQALTTNCISRCLSVPDGARLVHDLRQIRNLIELGAPVTAEARIEPGRRVRVRSGPMLGMEGTVVKRRGKDWLVVAVEFLQQGASVLLEDFQVEAF
jgi:transcription antitermination factor NusG